MLRLDEDIFRPYFEEMPSPVQAPAAKASR
jgi:hypothetical protein